MSRWQAWLEQQKQTWVFSNFDRQVGPLSLPRPCSACQSNANIVQEPAKFYDPTPADLDDDLEYVTHSSGPHGHFASQQRTNLVRDQLLNEESKSGPILEKLHCIYKYKFEGKINIMVGKVKRVEYELNDLGESLVSQVEVLQCPKRGQKKNNLYVDISAADSFNTDYYIRVIDHLQLENLLCWNLEMTDKGTFSKRRTGGKYGHHSFFVAETQIKYFYRERCFLKWRSLSRRMFLQKVSAFFAGQKLCG